MASGFHVPSLLLELAQQVAGGGRLSLLSGSLGLSVVVALLGLGFLYVYMLWPARAVAHIPCPPYSLPGLGHIPLLAKYESEAFVRLAREYGPIYRFHFARKPVVMVADAELCKELAVKQFKFATNHSLPAYIETIPLLQNALFFGKDKRWSSMRNIMIPLYHSEKLNSYVPVMSQVVRVLRETLAKKDAMEDINMSTYLLTMTMEVIGELAFGTKFGLFGEGKQTTKCELVDCANKFVNSLRLDGDAPLSTILGEFFPFLQWPLRKILGLIPGTGDWKMLSHISKLQTTLKVVLQKREDEENVERCDDMLSLLLSKKKTSPDLLTNDYINGLTFEMLLVGSETTSVTLAYALYLISSHPHVEKKLLEEIDSFGPPNLTPTAEDLHCFPYVEQVIKETLRIYTPSPVIGRVLSQDMQLGKHLLKRGTHVWMAMNAIMRDPRNFEDPEIFNPDRFGPDSKENKVRHPYAFSPFGLGPRMCIGYRLAMQEAKLALIILYQKFTFVHSPIMENPLTFDFGMVRRPKNGIWLRLCHR